MARAKHVTLGFLLVSVLLSAGCIPGNDGTSPPATPPSPTQLPPGQETVALVIARYGYHLGDVVLIDTLKEPQPGDVVYYDCRVNKSYCGAFGSGVDLARIIGKPGDNVSFSELSWEANGYTGAIEYHGWRRTKLVMWGNTKFDDVAGMVLEVPANEYVADIWIGQECPPGETFGPNTSAFYSRYTVKREAIKGVILKLVGHDKEVEEKYKHIVY